MPPWPAVLPATHSLAGNSLTPSSTGQLYPRPHPQHPGALQQRPCQVLSSATLEPLLVASHQYTIQPTPLSKPSTTQSSLLKENTVGDPQERPRTEPTGLHNFLQTAHAKPWPARAGNKQAGSLMTYARGLEHTAFFALCGHACTLHGALSVDCQVACMRIRAAQSFPSRGLQPQTQRSTWMCAGHTVNSVKHDVTCAHAGFVCDASRTCWTRS